jgi:hypothetical protein
MMWLYSMKSWEKRWDAERAAYQKQQDAIAEQHAAEMALLVEQQRQTFEVLKKFLDAIEYSGCQLLEPNTKIENNQFFPVIRKVSKPN